MKNNSQLSRYKYLLSFIDENLNENINIQKIEDVSYYSYRNINRIFEAIHQETIGKYIRRLRLEKAAQYLRYSEMSVMDIGFEVGFEDRVVFSKAFKKKYGCSPLHYREISESHRESIQQSFLKEVKNRQKLQFEIEVLPNFDYLFLEYRGECEASAAIEEAGNHLYEYANHKKLLTDNSVFMTEIIDDSSFGDTIHLRYNLGYVLDRPLEFQPEGFFRTKKHSHQKYAKFVHKGTYENCANFYNEIYAFWMSDVGLELVDMPSLEFYPHYPEFASLENMVTEIYIAVR
ncbi:MAG: AraC family transcriptional regulator [Bacteroidota bacterium]